MNYFNDELTPDQWINLEKIIAGEQSHAVSAEDVFKKYKTQEEIDAEPGTLKRGLMGGGVYGGASLLTGAAGLAADAVGADETANKLYTKSMDIAREGQEKYPQKVDFDKVMEDPSLSNITEWLGYNVAATAPMMIGSMGAGGVAGLTAKTVLKDAAIKVGEEAVKRATAAELASIGAEKIAEKVSSQFLAKAAGRIGTAGAAAAMTPVEAGGMWIDDAQKHGVENTSPFQDALMGAASGAIEMLPGAESRIIRAAFGDLAETEFKAAVREGRKEVADSMLGKAMQRVNSGLVEGGKEFLGEGAQESLQELTAMGNEAINATPGENPDLFNERGLKRLAESGIVGGVVGFGAGGVTGMVRHGADNNKTNQVNVGQAEAVMPPVSGVTDILNAANIEDDVPDFGSSNEQAMSQKPRTADQVIDLLGDEHSGLDGLQNMNPADRRAELFHQNNLDPRTDALLRQSYMGAGGFISDIDQGPAAQAAQALEAHEKKTEQQKLADVLAGLSQAKQQAEVQAQEQAIVQSPIGADLLRQKLEQEQQAAQAPYIPEQVPQNPQGLWNVPSTEPVALPMVEPQIQEAPVVPVMPAQAPVFEAPVQPPVVELPQPVIQQKPSVISPGTRIEWNDKSGNTFAGKITGLKGNRYEIERENPKPGQGRKTFLHTGYDVREVGTKSVEDEWTPEEIADLKGFIEEHDREAKSKPKANPGKEALADQWRKVVDEYESKNANEAGIIQESNIQEPEETRNSNYNSVADGQDEPDSLSDFMGQIEDERASSVLKATLNAIDNNSAWEQIPELKPYEDRIRQAVTDRIDTLNEEYDERDRARELKRQAQKESVLKGNFPVTDDKLISVDEITERIKSIESQIEQAESTGTSKKVVAWGNKHEKIKKLNERKDALRIKRAGLIKSSKAAPESQLEATETYSVIGKNADGRETLSEKVSIARYLLNSKSYDARKNDDDIVLGSNRFISRQEAESAIEKAREKGIDVSTAEKINSNLLIRLSDAQDIVRGEKGSDDRLIGTNKYGQEVYEDKNGVRSYIEGNIKVSEPVAIVPGFGKEISIGNQERFDKLRHGHLTNEEYEALKPQKPKLTEKTNELEKPSESTLERVQADDVQGASENRATERNTERSSEEDSRRNERAGEPRLSESRSMGDGEGEIPVSSRRKGIGGGRGSERGGKVVYRDGEGHEQDSSGGRRVLSGDEKPAGIPERADDFSISEEDAIGEGGAKTKFKNNIAAISLLKKINSENRAATKDEQKLLAKYVGWGGIPQAFYKENGSVSSGWEKEAQELKDILHEQDYLGARRSTQDAHYTSPEIVKGIWLALTKLGFRKGRVLEPSVGVGNFIGLMPKNIKSNVRVTGVELDPTTGGIAKLLYPGENIHPATGFQEFNTPDNHFDAAIGNPPFGSTKLFDSKRKEISKFSIHNYFFAKSIDAIRPGGLLAMVVSSNLMDASNAEARKYIGEKADLVAAWRLPNNAFLKNAGTEVTTDIIILQKREAGAAPNGVEWLNISSVKDPEGRGDVPLNEYFVKNPENMFGRFGFYGSMYRPDMPALISIDGQNTPDLLAKAIERLPSNVFNNIEREPVKEVFTDHSDIADVKVGSMFVKDGKVFKRGEDVLNAPTFIELQVEGKALDRVSGMIKIRDAFTTLRKLQLSETAKDKSIESARKTLNDLYDTFIKKNGFILGEANKRLFREDPTWPQLSALEEGYDKGVSRDLAKKTGEDARPASARKAAIFTKRTQHPYSKPTKATNAKDALSISLSQKGELDIAYMSSLYGKTEDEISAELKGIVFKTPTGEYQTKEQYLNGNVKKKLAEAIAAAKENHEYLENVEALKSVQPADVDPVDINVKFGSHWIPSSDMKAFINHISEASSAIASYVPATAKWMINVKGAPSSATTKWGTPRVSLADVLEAAANQRQITVKDHYPDGSSSINHEETAAANIKVDAVKEEWRNWIWSEDDRRGRLAKIYNDNFNTDNLIPHDGSHLSFPGKVGDDIIKLRPHQANAVWRILQDGKALLDHVVGAGKTFTMIAAAMEMRRTGISKKPLFVVPNHLVSQWAGDFIRLYPGANILAASKKDFEKSNRQRLFERITTGDWDAVIIAHSSFSKMPVDPDFEMKFLNEQLSDLEAAISAMREAEGKDARSVKQQEKMRDTLKTKIQKAMDKTSKDDVVNFGELGVDSLFVDEAHEFKRLAYFTSLQRVGGVTSGQGSNKAADLYMKVRQTMNATGGKNVIFATGTPISNSMAEMFTLQRYLDYDNLKGQGLSHFDAWARMFGEVVSDWELSPAGKYQMRSRFSKFVNIPELLSKYRGFADVINRDDIVRQLKERGQKLPVPKVEGGKPQNIVVERSPSQASYIGIPEIDTDTQQEKYPEGSLVWRSENLPKGKPQKGDDNMLVIMSDARKAALDMRLINPSAPDFAGSKVNTCAKSIKEIYSKWNGDKGTQLVFCDLSTPKKAKAAAKAEYDKLLTLAEEGDDEAISKLDKMSPDDIDALTSDFSVYDDLKDKLITLGIPSKEIAFIHDANTDAQKEELFAKVRGGTVRVLVGSSSKMGAGMNVQERLVALHHLDAPWRPSDLEQREGRIIRQGNKLYDSDPETFAVKIMRYATEQTLDSRMWQIIETKAKFIEQIRKGDLNNREIEDVDGEAANAAEMKAASSGNPLILEENDLRTKIKKLEDSRIAHERTQHSIRQKIAYSKSRLPSMKNQLESLESDSNAIPLFPDELELKGRKFDKRKDAGKVLLDEIRAYSSTKMENPKKIGYFGGFSVELEAYNGTFGFTPYVNVVREGVYGYDASFAISNDKESDVDTSGLVTRIENVLKRIAGSRDSLLKEIGAIEKDIPKLEAQLKTWDKTEELSDIKTRHRAVIEDLKPKKNDQPVKSGIDEAQEDKASGIKYSLSDSKSAGLSKSKISEALKPASSRMAFEVVQNESELPSHIKDDIGSKGFSGRAEALFDPESGKVYFVADNIGSEKAAQTGFLENLFRHEGRHAAISQMFESKGARNMFMDRAARAFKPDVESYLKKNGLENSKENVRMAAEEALVDQTVKGGVHALLDEFASKVMRWARKIFSGLGMTRAEARDFIRRADNMLKGDISAQKEGFSVKSDKKWVLEAEKEPVKYSLKNRATELSDLGIKAEYSDFKAFDENKNPVTEKRLTITGNFKDQYKKLMPLISGEYKFQSKNDMFKGRSGRNTYIFKNPSENIEQQIVKVIRAFHELDNLGLAARFRKKEDGTTTLFVDGNNLHMLADTMKRIGGKLVKPQEAGKKPFFVFPNPESSTPNEIAAAAKAFDDKLTAMIKVSRDGSQEVLETLVRPKDESARAIGKRIIEDVKSLFSKSDIVLPSNNTDIVKGLHWLKPESDMAKGNEQFRKVYEIEAKYEAKATQKTAEDREMTKAYYELSEKERKPVDKVLLYEDEERTEVSEDELKIRFGLSDKQIAGYWAIRNLYKKKLREVVQDMLKNAFSDFHFDDSFAKQIIDAGSRADVLSMLKDHGVDEKAAKNLSWIFDWISERKGYVPHKWNSEWLVRVNMPDGEAYLLDVPTITGNILPTKALREGAANNAAVRVIKERIGWSDSQIKEWIDAGNILLVKNKEMPVDLFHGASMHAMSAIIDSATDQAWEEFKDAFSPEQLMKQQDLKEAIRKQMEELFLAKGAGQHFITRKGVKGFRTDIANITGEYVGGMNHWMVKRDKATAFAHAMKDIDPKKTPELFKHAKSFVDDMLGESQEVSWFKKFAGIWFLGADVSAAALNSMQNFTHAAPLMTKIKGKGNVYSDLGKAMKDCFNEWRDAKKEDRFVFTSGSKHIKPEEADIIRDLYMQGFFDPAVVGEQTGFHPTEIWNNYADKTTKVLMGMFTGVEALNRSSTFLAAYRRANEAGVADPVQVAKQVVMDAHFAGGKKNRPLLIRRMGAIGNVAYTFMMFPVNNLFFLKDIFRDALVAIHGGNKQKIAEELKVVGSHLGALFTIGGLSAIPFANIWAPLVKGIFSDDDDDWEVALRKHLSPEVGRLLVRGVPAVLGNDMSGRISSDIIGMPAGFGVISTMAKRANKAADYAIQGETLDAVMIMAPDFIRNPYNAAMGMAEGGERKGRPPIKYNAWQGLNKALGFSPTGETEAYATKQNLDNVRSKRLGKLEHFAERLLQLQKKNDSISIIKLRKELNEYNEIQKKDDDPVIKWSSVIKSANQRRKQRNTGYMDRVPKNMKSQKAATLEAMGG